MANRNLGDSPVSAQSNSAPSAGKPAISREKPLDASPVLSVIIVTYNSAESILSCLRSILARTQECACEAIVVDNASRDNTIELIHREFGDAVKTIQMGRNSGFAVAVNRGIALAKGEFLLWLNPDATILSGDFRALVDYFHANPSVGIVGLQLLDPGGQIQLSCRRFPDFGTVIGSRYSPFTQFLPNNRFSRHYLYLDCDRADLRRVDWVSGAALAHRRSILAMIGGGLDESYFMYCEDVDFCLTAAKAGLETHYVPLLTIEHEIGGSSRETRFRLCVIRHKSMWHYYRKHLRRNAAMTGLVFVGVVLRCTVALCGIAFRRLITVGARKPVCADS